MPAILAAPLIRLILAASLACAAVPAARAALDPALPERITVVLDDNYPPYSFRDASGQLQGILKDSWELWQQKTGVAVDLRAMDWAEARAVMAAGQADVIDTLFRTPEREGIYDFSAPYADLDVVIAFDGDLGGIRDAGSLRGFAVGVKAGDACIEYLRGQGVDQLRPYPSYQEMVRAAARTELKVFCIDKPPASYLLYQAGLERRFRFTEALFKGQFHRAVKEGDAATLALVERGFGRFRPDEIEAIRERWLGSAVEAPWRDYGRYLMQGLWIGGLAVLLLGLWNLALRRTVAARTAALAEGEQRYRSLFELANDAILIMDGMRAIDCNDRALRLYGCRREDLIGRQPVDFAPAEQPDGEGSATASSRLVKLALAGEPQILPWVARRADGGLVDVEVSLSRFGPPGQPLLQAVVRDLSEHKRAQAEITRLSYYDPLTQLPNRQHLYDRLGHALADSRRHGGLGAVLLFDLDHFRTLIDTRGPREGDRLLAEVARRLALNAGPDGYLARSGGDEFVVVLEDLGGDAGYAATLAESVGRRLLSAIAEPYLMPGHQHECTASAGVTLFRGFDETADELLKRADAAMYRAKTAGRNLLSFYDPAVQAALEARAQLESELRLALPQGQFELHYQPQVDAAGRVVGAEALLRWHHPQRGLVAPGQFIPFAEESGLIVPIGYWVLETACARLAAWADRPGAGHVYLSVNVSARQFRQPDFVSQLKGLLERSRIDPGRLKLELTESLVVDNSAEAIAKMNAVKSLGVGFAMDDFGTGYSSLAYLKSLPLDQLKIDQSFVRDLATDPSDAVIVQTIIGMALNLGLDVVAEGVETVEQRAFLLQHGCTGFQGYLFGRPVPAGEFEAGLR
jgi:diguanylate cyclase (GGDEF)-like protein/PAS domain S-box-containing protein